MLMKHTDSQYVYFSCLGCKKKQQKKKKKKKKHLPTHFFETCYSKHNFFCGPYSRLLHITDLGPGVISATCMQ